MRLLKRIARLYRHLCVLHDPVLDLPRITSVEEYVKPYSASELGLRDSVSIDLGCGDDPRNPFGAMTLLGVDIKSKLPNVRIADIISERFPYDDESADYITAFDFIEHIPRVVLNPRRNPFVDVMSEIRRVLKPGGIFLSHTPCVPFPEAFQDPTHVNFITVNTFPYYFGTGIDFGEPYGCKRFEILDQALLGFELVSVLRKPAGDGK